MYEIIVAELSLSNVIHGEVLPNLRQTCRRINKIFCDGVYNTRPCYETVHI
ncbi:hypothetical protein BTN50_2118 [Candidatus Enterovibrio altilux]|uniref:Mobile element protein n=1 Tax=Candidatus Enterovibrio altilux TaxID=1927128 RepID=A0A291BC03_9GAMM|nr:hypothetical protein BTN50_2118 [Candidatus Enterovibrio luxaltus]